MLSKSAGAIGVSIGQQVRIVRKNRDERFTLYYSVGNAVKRYIYICLGGIRSHPSVHLGFA